MAIAATVIADMQATTLIALINMAAHIGSTAAAYSIQRAPLPAVEFQLFIGLVPITVQYSSYLKGRPHGYLPYNRSGGLKSGLFGGLATCR